MIIDREPEQSAHARMGGRPLLLIVDDQPSNIQVLFSIFKDDYDVCMALSGEATFTFLEQRLPDLILLDVVMPEVSGFDVCRRLKGSERTADIPVIFVTANSDPEEEARGLVAGAVDFIVKPFHATVVKARVNTQLTVKRQADQLRAMAMIDGLTGVANRRRFDAALEMEWRRAAREGGELAVEQAHRHEVPFAGPHPSFDEVPRSVEVNEPYLRFTATQGVAVDFLEGGAGDDPAAADRLFGFHVAANRAQPRPAVFVLERRARLHLGDVGGRVKSVGIAELPAQALAQSLTQRGLAGAGHSHDDEKHGVRFLDGLFSLQTPGAYMPMI